MASPIIILDHLTHREVQNIRLDFEFDAGLIVMVKATGAKWSKSHKCWYLENTEENLKKVAGAFKGKAHIDSSRFEARKELFPKTILQKTHAAQRNFGGLSQEAKENIHEFGKYLESIRYSGRTIENYTDALASFLGFCGTKKVREIGLEDVERFNSEHIIRNQYSVSYQRQVVSALKLFYARVPGCSLNINELERPLKSRRLPMVLSTEEIMGLLKYTPNLKHKSMLACIYSSGLRISELLNLRISDIDIHRMQIRIVKGKGDRDRMVGLSRMFLEILKRYAEAYKPVDYLFNGEGGGRYSAESVRKILKKACSKAGIRKRVTPHVLRHSYATHMLENGVDLRYIQELLGHKKPETTMIYAHVAQKKLTAIKSPLDVIGENLDKSSESAPLLGGGKQEQKVRPSAENEL